MRTTTRKLQRQDGRRSTTQRFPDGRRGAAPSSRRGPNPRRPKGRNPLLGILSIIAFALFWVFLLVAFNSLVVGVQGGDGKRIAASAGLGLFAFAWPIAGLILGIVGVTKQNSHKVLGGIGLGLNALLGIWILVSMVSRH